MIYYDYTVELSNFMGESNGWTIEMKQLARRYYAVKTNIRDTGFESVDLITSNYELVRCGNRNSNTN